MLSSNSPISPRAKARTALVLGESSRISLDIASVAGRVAAVVEADASKLGANAGVVVDIVKLYAIRQGSSSGKEKAKN